jgi:uncharacterized membrane protein YdjX (TVP38/TMEM64 family)
LTDPESESPVSFAGSEPAPKREAATGKLEATDSSPLLTDWLRIALPVLVIAGLIALAWRFGYFNLKTPDQLDAATDKVEGLPWLAPAFVLLYAILATLAAPVSPLAYGAGALFGVVKGSVYVWLGSILGASAGYFLARTSLAGAARRLLGRFHDKLSQLRHGNAFIATLRLQLLPVLPFGIFNYAAGVTRLRFLGFITGTAVGILPGTIAAVYVGDRLVAGVQTGDKRAFVLAGVVVAAMFSLSFVPTLMKKLRRRA